MFESKIRDWQGLVAETREALKELYGLPFIPPRDYDAESRVSAVGEMSSNPYKRGQLSVLGADSGGFS